MGQEKINLNQNDMEQLYNQLEEALGQEWATFIVAYRLGEPVDPGDGNPNVSLTGTIDLDLSQQPQQTLTTVLDLIGKNVRLPSPNEAGNNAGDSGGSRGGSNGGSGGNTEASGGPPPQPGSAQVLESPFPNQPGMMDYLPTLMDHVAVVVNSPLAGRININQAPRTVLEGIPGMTPQIVDQIIGQRQPDPTLALPDRRHETWILSERIVTLDQMKELIPFICAGGCVYRAQVIGYFDQGGPAVRLETVLDGSSKPPRIVFFRDISNLGRGYPRDALGVGTGTGSAY